MIDKCIKESCTGCNMCGDICPQGAICYVIDEEGFWYPKVDYNKCINCGLCKRTCPILCEKKPQKDNPVVYEAWIKDEEIRLKSTSGGVYYALAREVLKKGGYLVGSIYGDDFKSAYHTIAKSEDGLNRIMGSKYFQSNAEGIYSKTKEILLTGELVLFCGTPCQCVALQNFLGKEYSNLIIVDFVCRGINSPLAFKSHIEELEKKYNSKVKRVHLKNKKTGWQSLATYVEFENGKNCHQDKTTSSWVKGFVGGGGLYIRESCHQCHFKGFPRLSDISIADFWGIKGKSERDMFSGISLVLVNSKKGKKLFFDISNDIEFQEHTLEDALPGNPALIESAQRNKKRDDFFPLMKKYGFEKAVKLCTKEGVKVKIKNKLRHAINKARFICSLDVFKFIYYNFFSKNIVRDRKTYLFPHKGVIMDLSKNSRIYLKGRNAEFGYNIMRGSKAETQIRMEGNAKWYLNNGCQVFYNTVVEVKNNAVLNTDFFSMNGGSVIICAKKICFGEDVMLGRNIVIYDSDHHQVLDCDGNMRNYSKEIVIGDHVWLTNQILVQKGVTIGEGSLIGAYTIVRKDVPSHSMVVNGSGDAKIISDNVCWSRKRVEDIG